QQGTSGRVPRADGCEGRRARRARGRARSGHLDGRRGMTVPADTGALPIVTAVRNHADIPAAPRIVVKVGSSSVTGDHVAQIDSLVDALVAAREGGAEVILVSSGAIATAIPYLGLDVRLRDAGDLATQQAAA